MGSRKPFFDFHFLENRLKQIFSPQKNFFTEKPENLLDVQSDETNQEDNIWRFILKDKIKSYKPSERRWFTDDIELGEIFDEVEYKKLSPNGKLITFIAGFWVREVLIRGKQNKISSKPIQNPFRYCIKTHSPFHHSVREKGRPLHISFHSCK